MFRRRGGEVAACTGSLRSGVRDGLHDGGQAGMLSCTPCTSAAATKDPDATQQTRGLSVVSCTSLPLHRPAAPWLPETVFASCARPAPCLIPCRQT
jgi:hypothetical protein